MDKTPIADIVRLSGKTAIVTGGAMGIGYGIAYRLAEAGASVVIADLNEAVAKSAADTLTAKGWVACAISADVSDSTQAQNVISETISKYGSVDILVNNAGIYPNIPVMKLSEKEFDKILSVNLKGVFLMTQLAAAQMIAQGNGGKIINITSVDAVHPSMIGLATYDASKHGVWGFTKNIALELAPHNIWVNAIAPGGISTPGAGSEKMTPEMLEQMKPFLAKIPMKRLGDPDEIGKVALFLASDLSSYMTGSQVFVDGGVLLS